MVIWAIAIARLRRYLTARHKADRREQQRLRETPVGEGAEAARERTRGILDNITVGFVALDREWRMTYLNPRATEMIVRFTGRDSVELFDRSIWDEFPELLDTPVERECRNALETMQPAHFFEHLDFCGIWVEVHALPSGHGLAVYFCDITERKQAEEDLRTADSHLEHLLVASPAVLYTAEVDRDYRATFISPNVRDQLGYDPDDFTSDPGFWRDNIHPEDRDRVVSDLSALFQTDRHIHEYRFLHRDGSWRWMHDELRLLRDESGSPREIVGYWIDITERKRTEEALRESKELFRQLTENIREVFWLSNADATQILYISPSYNTIWGRDPESVYENPRDWSDAIHEADRDRVRALLAPDCLQQEGIAAEFRIRRPDGEVRWISARGVPIRDEGGRSYRLAGIAEDITERKRVEEELAEEARTSTRFATALENLSTGVLITDPAQPDDPVIYANRGFTAVTGYMEHEVLGRNARLLQGPETDPHAVREIGAAIEERRPFHGRVLNYRKDGTPFWNEMTISPVLDSRGGSSTSSGCRAM